MTDLPDNIDDWTSHQGGAFELAADESVHPPDELAGDAPIDTSASTAGPSEISAIDPQQDRFWELASAGKLTESYKLADSIHDPPGFCHARLASYFLLRQRKDRRDKKRIRQRVAMLLEIMHDQHLADTAFDLLEQELALLREAALFPEVSKFLTRHDDANTTRKVMVARWNALGPNNAHLIVEDFNQLKKNAAFFGSTWPRLVYDCMRYTVWDPSDLCKAHNRACWSELAEGNVKLDVDYADEMKQTIIAAKERLLFPSNRLATFWLRPISRANTGWPMISPKIWQPYARRICENLSNAISELEHVEEVSSVGLTFIDIGLKNLAAWYQSIGETAPRNEIGDCADYLINLVNRPFDEVRLEIARFCCENRISPRQVAALFDERDIVIRDIPLASVVDGDIVLACLFNASIACT